MEKKRNYNEHILQVENGRFILLVWWDGGKTNKCYSHIAKKLAEK